MTKKTSKEAWISAKIAKLIKEGKPKDQAAAIAFSMWKDRLKKKRK